MNFIIIMCDTMRADHLGCYGNDWIKTPNLDAFAKQSTVFERAYCASWPTIPNRTDLFTGRFGEPLHPWRPLSWEAITLPEIMRESGYVSHLIHDTPHLVNYGFGFDRPFHSWWMIRGNEVDRFNSDHGVYKLDFAESKTRRDISDTYHGQYLRNIINRRTEKDYFAPMVMSAGMDWLDRNYRHDKFFLWIDSFDPHEPWDPPQHYVDLYDPGFKGDVPTNFFNVPNITPRELKQIRARYAGEVTMVDKWVGLLLEKLDGLGIADDTFVLVTSDHGTGLGDHGAIQKTTPTYEEVGRIVWLMKLPKGLGSGKRIKALVQPPDLMPTVLELSGLKVPDFVQGSSLLPLVNGDARKIRDFAVTGPAGQLTKTTNLTVSTSRWALHHTPTRDKWRLFDLNADPLQKKNVLSKNKGAAERLHKQLLKWLAEHECPEWLLEAYEKCEERQAPSMSSEDLGKQKRMLNTNNFFRGEVEYAE